MILAKVCPGSLLQKKAKLTVAGLRSRAKYYYVLPCQSTTIGTFPNLYPFNAKTVEADTIFLLWLVLPHRWNAISS